MDFDFHTHRLDIIPGTGIVSLPQDIVRQPEVWNNYPSPQQFHPEGRYAAGIHPRTLHMMSYLIFSKPYKVSAILFPSLSLI